MISGGCANLNYKLTFSGDVGIDPLVLRVYLRDPSAAIREQKLASLIHNSIPVPAFFHVGEEDGYHYALAEFVSGISLRDLFLGQEKYEMDDLMSQAGKLLGAIQNYKFPHSGFFDRDLTLGPPLSAEWLASYARGCLTSTTVVEQLGSQKIALIEQILTKQGHLFPDESHSHLVHADFNPANILVSKDGNSWNIAAVLDWEFAFSGSWLCDVANMLRYAHKLPSSYEESFLRGIKEAGLILPAQWRVTVNLLNLLSLLDCLVRCPPRERPRQCADICELMDVLRADVRSLIHQATSKWLFHIVVISTLIWNTSLSFAGKWREQMPRFQMPKVESYEDFEKLKQNETLWETAALRIVEQHGLVKQPLTLFPDGSNIVFAHGADQIIKIFVPVLRDQFESEKLVLEHVYGKLSVLTPKLEFSGELDGWPYLVMTRIEGRTLEGLWEKLSLENKVTLVRQLGKLIREMHSLSIRGLESIDSQWDTFLERQINNCAEHHGALSLPMPLVKEIPSYLAVTSHLLPRRVSSVLLTGEYTPMNLIVKEVSGSWELHGLIDFGDSMLGPPEYDLLGPGVFLIQGDRQLAREFLVSYGYVEKDLNLDLSQKLTALTLLHKHSNLNAQIRITNWQSRVSTLLELEKLIWSF